MRAVSLHDLLDRQSGASRGTMPSVRDVAQSLTGRFGKAYGREMLPLLGEGGREGDDEVRDLQEIVQRAEEEAVKVNKERGGWGNKPDI